MKSLARLFSFEGFKVLDVQVFVKDQSVKIFLSRDDLESHCHRCGHVLGHSRGQYRMRVQELSLMNFKTEVIFWRRKAHCSACKKARAESISFLAQETPHFTQRYADFLGTMCEFGAVSRVAEFNGLNSSTLRKLDFNRLRRMLQSYKIPDVTHMAVDEVYAIRYRKGKHNSRSRCFFTVISDLNTRRVIWVSQGRSQKALDEFYQLLGPAACKKIKVVAMDQFDGYFSSTQKNCPNAKIVWDKFHLMKNFEEAANQVRKELHNELASDDPLLPLTRGKYRFVFLKKNCRRTVIEKRHIEDVAKQNGRFYYLELIKEAMLQFFDHKCPKDAKEHLDQVTAWIYAAKFQPLIQWINEIQNNWDTLKNYFDHRVTSALAEGVNNVIKALKRQAFGYRNLDYFAYKIMQKCGYLNSRYINQLQS